METEFTPLAALIGGSLIGLASVGLMAAAGRIMGATGILAGFLSPASAGDWAWRAAVLAGMILAVPLLAATTGVPVLASITTESPVLILGGVLVGIGATLGAGCPSGHGVCGIARLSPRSIAATATFMATTALTVYVTRHLIGG